MTAIICAMNKIDCIIIKHTCGHEIPTPACYMQPHRVRNEERRPCAQCRDQERAGAAVRNWQRGLPALDGSRCSSRQMLLAEELRERFGWQLERAAATKATDPIWWIAEYAAQKREEDAAEQAQGARHKAQSPDNDVFVPAPGLAPCALRFAPSHAASASPAEVVAAPAPNLTAAEKARQDQEFERIFGDGPRDPEPPTGSGGGRPRACETCGQVESPEVELVEREGWLLCVPCADDGPEPAPEPYSVDVETCPACCETKALLDCGRCGDCCDCTAKEETMSTVRRQTTEAAGGAVLSRQTVEAAALYNGCAEELRRALHGTEGAAKRWAEHRRQGLTNDELKHAIGRQWGMDYGADSPGKGFRTKGGKNPRFWLGFYARANDKPTLQGPALVAAVRELLQIPKPKEAAAALAPAAVDLDPRSVTCPQCAAPAGSPCKRPSGHVIPFGEVHAPRRAALVAANLPPAEKAAREAHIRSIIDEDRPRPPAVAPEPAAPAITMLAVEQIRRSPLNPRTTFDEAALAELAASIEQSGLLQPLVVRPVGYGYELLAGERRLRACLKTCLAQVPCIVREGVSDEEALSLMLVENLQRADLNPIEEASAYAQLSEMGMTQEQIAARVGRSRPAVANAIRLLKLPEAVKAMVAGGQITAAHGAALLHWATPAKEKKCLRLADSARKGYYSSKSLEDQARYDIQEEKRREERKAREAEAGAKGGAAVATGPTWQELEAQRDAERRSQRDARQPVVAELAEALREAREAGPILEDRRAMAVLASRMMGRALGLLTETLHQAGHGDLADYFDWSKHSFADRYEALAQLDAETLLTLAFRVEMAEELRGFAEWDQGRPSIDWYLGLPDEEEPSIDEEDDQGDGVPA